MASLVILAALLQRFLRYHADKQTDRQTNANENFTAQVPSAWAIKQKN